MSMLFCIKEKILSGVRKLKCKQQSYGNTLKTIKFTCTGVANIIQKRAITYVAIINTEFHCQLR